MFNKNEYQRKYMGTYWERHPEKYQLHKERVKEQFRQMRYQVLFHYSNGELKCACCGEKEYQFLTIDHINGKGREERRKEGMGSSFYRYLIKNNFPKGFQVLCMNCNFAKGHYGKCPHTS